MRLMDAKRARRRLACAPMLGRGKQNDVQGEAVVVEADWTGMSNGKAQRKYKLTLRVRTPGGTMVDATCKAYGVSAGPDTHYRAGAVIPVRYDPKDPKNVEVDREALAAGAAARRQEARDGLVRMAEERLAAGGGDGG